MADEQTIKDEVWQTILAMNRTWTVDHDPDKLHDYFHPDMVAITPSDRLRREGREACIAGWKQFAESVRIMWWKESEPLILLFNNGQTAVVTYYWDIEYEIGGKHVHTNGRDLFVMVKEEGRWWAVADQFSSFPKE